MEFKEAFEMVLAIHQQCGDHVAWNNLRSELVDETKRYKTGEEMMTDLYRRTDLSQDMRWIYEEMDESIRVLFALMYPKKASE